MRKIIYTVAVGNGECFNHCVESQKQYAKKVDADMFCRREWTMWNEDLKTDCEKRYIVELLKNYDKVLYLDADVFIRDSAIDIFEAYKDNNDLIIYNEVLYNNVNMDNHIQRAIIKNNIKWWNMTNSHYDWLNAGVMLCSKGHEKVFEYNSEKFFKFEDMPMIYDMPYMHYNIYKYKIPVTYMDERFNTMVYFHDNGDFLHFANVLNRNERIMEYVKTN
jgi:hypothetical protein